jgi:hypothetical protein
MCHGERLSVNEVRRAAVKLFYATASSEDYHDAIPSLSMALLTLLMLSRSILDCQDCENISRAQEPLTGTMDFVHSTSILALALLAYVKALQHESVCSHGN